MIRTVKGFGVVNEIYVFLEFSCFFSDPTDVGTLISGSSAFSQSSFNVWNFSGQVLLKPGLESFEHYFVSMWNEYNCAVVWTFFGIALVCDWNEKWSFPVLWLLLIECSTFTASSFRIWNSSAGIPSPPLAVCSDYLYINLKWKNLECDLLSLWCGTASSWLFRFTSSREESS